MKLYNIIESIKAIAEAIPNMGTIGDGSVYEFNQKENITYPCFNITQQEITENFDEYYKDFHLYLFTFDRLLNDKSNTLDIQSHSIQILKSIIEKLEESDVIVNSAIYHTFEERLNDLCAGAYVDVSLRVLTNDCGDYEITIGDVILMEKNITSNGTYTAPTGIAYDKVNVNVPSKKLGIYTKVLNGVGEYYIYAKDDPEYDGYSEVILYVKDDEKEEQIETLTKDLQEANETITEQQTTISEKTAEIEEKEAQIEEKDTTIAEQNNVISGLNDTISDLNEEVAEKDEEIDTLTEEVAQKKIQKIIYTTTDGNPLPMYTIPVGCTFVASASAEGQHALIFQGLATSLDDLFYGCTTLKSVDFSEFDCSRAKRMVGTFRKCSSLTSLDLSNLNTSSVEYMDWTFMECDSLTDLTLNGEFTTANCKSLEGIFMNSGKITTLDISGFDTSNVEEGEYDDMFTGCNPTTIKYCGSTYTLDNLPSSATKIDVCA